MVRPLTSARAPSAARCSFSSSANSDASTTTEPGVEDARIALQIALAARTSFEAGGAKVAVPPLAPLRPIDPIASKLHTVVSR